MGYAKSYVYKLTSAGILPFSKPRGKKIFFEREKLEQWMLSGAKTSQVDITVKVYQSFSAKFTTRREVLKQI